MQRRLFIQNVIKGILSCVVLEKLILSTDSRIKTNLSHFQFIGAPETTKYLIYDAKSDSASHMQSYLKNLDRTLFNQVRKDFEKSGKFISSNKIHLRGNRIVTQIEFDSNSSLIEFQKLSALGRQNERMRREQLGIKLVVVFSSEPSPFFQTQV